MSLPSGPVLTAGEMRAAEQAAATGGITLYDLMERAGAAVAEAVWRFGGGRPTLIVCGPGNNGGDGYVAARLLAERGLDVRVAAPRPPRAPEAVAAASRWTGPVEPLADVPPAPVLVDALFGTGLVRALEDGMAEPLRRLAEQAGFVIAVDVPSGVDADDGRVLGGFAADLTLAFGSLKPAHCLHPAAALCGTVKLVDIGVVAEAFANCRTLGRPRLFAPSPSDHKYTRGYIAIVGGQMAGAAVLAARGAMPLAGYVAMAAAKRPGPDALVHRRWDEIAEDKRINALLIGPGLGRNAGAEDKLASAFATGLPLVIDGDALVLTSVDVLAAHHAAHILTPHDGEFVTLFGGLQGSRIDRARAAAAASGSVVVLKGAPSIVASPDGRCAIAATAPGWLASAGTGDVLAGICVARLAACGDPFRAACEAVWLHAEAARLAGPGLTADDLPRHLPPAIAACL